MFGELPKLFDRNFAIGYFLPVAIFITVSIGLLNEFGLSPALLSQGVAGQLNMLIGTTFIGLISWLGGIFLLAANKDILRLLEGYGRFNPARLFHSLEKQRYERLKQEISILDEEYLTCSSEQKEFPAELRRKRNKLMQEIVERFPDEERWILPTSFGNTIRAFEVYPRRMYGLDAIPGWSRLLAVISEDYRELVDNAKAQVDLWSNIWLLSVLFIAEYLGIAAYTGQIKVTWVPFATLVVIFIAYSRARTSAIGWGDMVKSSFDVFLPDLCEKLGFSVPATKKEQEALWRKFSQAVIYVNPEYIPNKSELPDDSSASTR